MAPCNSHPAPLEIPPGQPRGPAPCWRGIRERRSRRRSGRPTAGHGNVAEPDLPPQLTLQLKFTTGASPGSTRGVLRTSASSCVDVAPRPPEASLQVLRWPRLLSLWMRPPASRSLNLCPEGPISSCQSERGTTSFRSLPACPEETGTPVIMNAAQYPPEDSPQILRKLWLISVDVSPRLTQASPAQACSC